MENIFDETNDKIQKALNEAKKKEIEEKYGASFGASDNTLPPELESQWLSGIEEFEQKFENAKRITVRELVGNPMVKPLSEISEADLHKELEIIINYLSDHHVNIDFLCAVPDAEAYRFITEELLDEETDDIQIEGMSTNFIYEEFYPNLELDAKQFAEQFLWHLFDRELEYAIGDIAKDEVYTSTGERITVERMQNSIVQFYSQFAAFSFSRHEIIDCDVEGDYATVRFNSTWKGLSAVTMKEQTFSGLTTLRMKKSPYGGCDVIQVNVVGVEL